MSRLFQLYSPDSQNIQLFFGAQVLREVPGDDVAQTAIAVSHSGRVVFTGTSSGAIRAVKYPLPIQKDWTTHQAHCGPVSKVGP